MNVLSFKKMVVIGCLLVSGASAQAATMSFTTIDDGATASGALTVDTTNYYLSVVQSGKAITNAILEFDLSALSDGVTVNSVSLDLTLNRFVSNTSGAAEVDVFAYNGDGAVTVDDYDAFGTQVVDTSTPIGGTAGDVRSFMFTDVSPIQAALVGDLLTLRIETDSFASMQFASLEHALLDAAKITVDYTELTVGAVPVPAAAFLFAPALLGFVGLRRKAKKS